MKRLLSACVLALVVVFLGFSQPTNPGDQPSVIRIGSFNLQAFGPTKAGRPNTLRVIAAIATNFDVLAYQEVGSNGSTATEATCKAVMDTLVAAMNGITGRPVYSYVRGNQYAIVYNTERVNNIGHALYSGTQVFSYTPWSATSRLSGVGSTLRSWTSIPAPGRPRQRSRPCGRRLQRSRPCTPSQT